MTDTLNETASAAVAKTADAAKEAVGEKGFLEKAQSKLGAAYDATAEVVSAAYETTVEAVKERPVAAAAIGAGVAATVAGATYGAAKLKSSKAKPATAKKLATAKKPSAAKKRLPARKSPAKS